MHRTSAVMDGGGMEALEGGREGGRDERGRKGGRQPCGS